MRWRWGYLFWIVILLIAGAAWLSDEVTLQGERTIYTADCRQGQWTGDRCSGKLVAGDRYRYRALRARGEVLFWVAGSSEPSGKFTGCRIVDGRNWSCPANAANPRSVTLAMARGAPVPGSNPAAAPYHAVSKMTWLLLSYGLWSGNTAAAPPSQAPVAMTPPPRHTSPS